MTKFVAILVLPLSLAAWWNRATRPTNSHAANVRGIKAYAAHDYAKSTAAFGVANAADPKPLNAFNLGTSRIAAGQREQGSATLGEAMRDPALRADALYNRGNSALTSNAFDNAIRDYAAALRLRPADANAKRNLEIALARRQQARQSQSGQQKNPNGSQPNRQQPQSQSGMQKRQPEGGEQNMEALLRAVQEQEQEELNRMKRAKAERWRVGW